VAVTLNPVNPASLTGGSLTPASTPLAGFATNDPTRLCLESDPELTVTSLVGSPGVYAPGSPGDAPTTTTTPPDPTSTTTTDPTSTTSTTAPQH
jgi:hypothetical protein